MNEVEEKEKEQKIVYNRGVYANLKCDNKLGHPQFNPTEHQLKTKEAFLASKFKGMLLYHKLGSGKTCTSILIADEMLEKKMINRVFILSPGSLRENWVSEYCKKCGRNASSLSENYIFITYNYAVGKNLPNFDNGLVIVDEVHNLINGVKNGSKNPSAIYNAISLSNCRVLLLSGTPIFNWVYEFALLGRLLKPGTDFPEVRDRKGHVNIATFMSKFNKKEDGTLLPNNRTEMIRMFEGIISYYPGSVADVPETVEEPIIKVEMTPYQESRYWAKNEIEVIFARPVNPKLYQTDRDKYEKLKKLHIMAKKNILTRQVSNFYYPPKYRKTKDILVSDGGWIDHEVFQDGKLFMKYSTKIAAFLLNLVKYYDQKHVLFTMFKTKSGVYLIQAILKMCGIRSEIFSGDLDDQQRKYILSRFNSENNKHGEKIRALLVTEAGAEGISVLEARHMHILESSHRMNRTIQAIGRVARFRSHSRLPLEERKVQVWRYWSTATPEPYTLQMELTNPDGEKEIINKTITNKETVDELLYKRGMIAITEVNSFLQLLQDSSIEKVIPPKKILLKTII